MNTAHQISHLIELHRLDREKSGTDTTMEKPIWVEACQCGWRGESWNLHLTMTLCGIDGVWTPADWWLLDRPEVGWIYTPEKWCETQCIHAFPAPGYDFHKRSCVLHAGTQIEEKVDVAE